MAERSFARAGGSQCLDGLLWIGGSYHFIECGSADNCAVPERLSAARGQARCFVHEAEWRGISRKVPAVPQWAVPGETRIFLAHRGGSTEAHHGRLFGYFVLHRVEVLSDADTQLAPPDVQQELPWGGPKGEGALTVTVYDAVTGHPLRGAEVQADPASGAESGKAEKGDYSSRLDLPAGSYHLTVSMPSYEPTELDGIRVPSGKRRKVAVYLQPGKREAATGKERTRKCPDGSVIVTHRYVDGKWHRTREKCSATLSPPACEEGALEWTVCSEGSLIPGRICLGGEWRDTGVRCAGGGSVKPGSTPINDEVFVLHRACSLRLRPGAVYLVDALCAAINDRFSRELRQTGLPERYKTARDDNERWDLVLDGRKRFSDIATSVSDEWKAASKVAGQLAGRAGHRGELVLFQEPVSFVRKPQAWFRGLERIDGEDLLNQIAAGVREPTIRIYVPVPKEPALTKREIAAKLAEKERTTVAAVEDLLDALAEVARWQLSPSGPGAVRLPRIGILCAAGAKNPAHPANRADLETEIVKHLPTFAETQAPLLKRAVVHSLLDDLAEVVAGELRATGTLRLPMIGTLRRRGTKLNYTPAKSLAVAAVTFVPFKSPTPSTAG